MKWWYVLALFSFSTGISLAVEIVEYKDNAGQKRIILQNKWLASEFLPEASALFSGLQYLPEKRPLINPVKTSSSTDDLLPSALETNSCGGRELLWGKKHFANVLFPVSKREATQESGHIVFSNRYLLNENLEATKKVTLLSDSLYVRICFTLTNHEKQAQTLRFWTNFIPQLSPDSSLDIVLLPACGGVRQLKERGVTFFEHDCIYEDKEFSNKEVFVAPAQPWMGRRSDRLPGVLVMCTSPVAMGDSGFLYSYKRGPHSPTHTMEMVFAPVEIKSGASADFIVDYLFFPHLNSLSGICGKIGFDVQDQQLLLEAAAECKGGFLELEFRDAAAAELSRTELQVSDLQTGILQRYSFRVPLGASHIAGSFDDGRVFTLLLK
ncbi:MAG: hypothetical protein WCT05_11305 [Lentisphaeria bacterium]